MDVSTVGRVSNGDLMRQREEELSQSVSFNETTFPFAGRKFPFLFSDCANRII